MKKILGRAKLSYEEMETVLCEVEATINSRPLTYVTNEPSETLTPSHFVIGRRLLTSSRVGEGDDKVEATPETLNRRLNFLSTLLNSWWKRFHKDYLNELQERHLLQRSKFDNSCKLLLLTMS